MQYSFFFSSVPSLNLFWLIMVSTATAVFLEHGLGGESKTAKTSNSLLWEWHLSLPSLLVADDQFSLTPSNRHKRVNSFQTCLHWFVHTNSRDDSRRFDVNTTALLCCQWALYNTPNITSQSPARPLSNDLFLNVYLSI